MPRFFVLPSTEVKEKLPRPGRKPQLRNEYVSYIQRVRPDQGGRLVLADDENPATIRTRLYRAARSIGVKLRIGQVNNEILFVRPDKRNSKKQADGDRN